MKFLGLLSLSAIFLCAKFSNAQNWRVASPYIGPVNDIVFTDPLTGYACGGGPGIGNCSASALILKTIDAGATWIRLNSGTTNTLERLFFKDAFTGWALGDFSSVFKTTDGAVTWTPQTSGVGAGLNDIFFPDYNTGYICGENGILRKSINGGANFTTINSGVTTTLYGLYFVNASTGYIIGDNGVIRKTINGGTSFNSVSPSNDAFRDIQFVNDTTGFVLANNKILKTTDGGSNWTTFNADPSWIMKRIHFFNSRIGFVSGDSGLLLKTTDGGDTWNLVITHTLLNPTGVLRCTFFTDENTGFISKDLGQIFKSTDGGFTWNSVLSGMSDELYSVHFRNRANGIVVGRYGGVYQTENGGLGWRYRNREDYVSLNRVRWLTDDKAIAVGINGAIIRSDDKGMNWYRLNTGVNETMQDIHVLDSSTIFVTFGSGKLMKTSDGGSTWDTTMNTSSTFPLTGVYFLNRDTGYVCSSSMEIYRTYDGGSNWELKNDSVSQFTSFNDIYFTSKDTGYVAGTFGKLYRTINGGEWWHAMYPSGSANAVVNEMQFLHNDTGYFAGSTSQRATFNASATIGVLPTACLANNWETHSISMPENGYGYCVGGQSNLVHSVQKDSMLSTYLQDSIFCAGTRIFVGYLASGLLLSSQILDVQLSDAGGSFANPTIIGTFQIINHTIDPSGIATCTLPPGINGTGYRIRVVCNSPLLISPDNGYDLTIKTSNTPDITLALLNSKTCIGDMLEFSAQAMGGGTDPQFTWKLDHQLLEWQASMISIDTLQGTHSLSVTMNSSLTCATASSTDSVDVKIYSNPTIEISGDNQLCYGESILLSAITAVPDPVITWTPLSILTPVTSTQVYALLYADTTVYATVANDHLCTATDSIALSLFSIPPTPVLSIVNGNLVVTGYIGNLIWYKEGVMIPNPNHDTLFTPADGNYQVLATDANGCGAFSQSVLFTALGIEDVSDNSIHAFFNHGVLQIKAPGLHVKKASVNLFDVSGRIILTKNIALDAVGFGEMEIKNISKGIYFSRIEIGNIRKTLKVVVD